MNHRVFGRVRGFVAFAVTTMVLSASARAEPELFAPDVISTGDDESHPTFSPDGDTLFFLKNTPLFDHWTVLVTSFEDDEWSRPVVAPFSGQYADADVVFTGDGKRIYFVSNRPTDGSSGEARTDTDIWTATRDGGDWTEPEHVTELGSPADEWFPTLTDDRTLYFGSHRDGGAGGSDIWFSRRNGEGYGVPENLGAPINTEAMEIEAWIAPDETYMIFSASGRPDSLGEYDLYYSEMANGRWSEPVNLGPQVNSAGWDFSPRPGPAGKYLYFTSNRRIPVFPYGQVLNYDQLIEQIRSPGNGLRDIYRVDLDEALEAARRK